MSVGLLNLGLTASRRTAVVSGSAIDASVTAYAAAVASAGGTVSAPRQALLSSFVAGLKADGVWALLDRLMILAAEDTAGSLVDLRNPAKLSFIGGAPPFTVDRGYNGDAVSAYIDAGEVANAAGNQFSLNAASVFSYFTSAATPVGISVGTTSGSLLVIAPAGGANSNTYRLNDTTASPWTGSATRGGFRAMSRIGTLKSFYYNPASATPAATATVAASAISAFNVSVLRNSTGYSAIADRAVAAGWGTSLSDTDAFNLYNRLLAFLTAIGAQ